MTVALPVERKVGIRGKSVQVREFEVRRAPWPLLILFPAL